MDNFSANEYQKKAKVYDLNSSQGEIFSLGFIEKILGLVGESGETADKIKKILRDKKGDLSMEDKNEIVKELGDITWYVAMIAESLGVEFSEVLRLNIEKLESRKNRGKLSGEGDNR